jgi:hypothetical protein
LPGQPAHTGPLASAAALLHAIVRLRPLEERNGIFAWPAAYALLGLNDITMKASPSKPSSSSAPLRPARRMRPPSRPASPASPDQPIAR